MVSSGKRKPDKSAASHKSGSGIAVQIRKSIPFVQHAIVKRTEVARKTKKHVVTESTNVVVPLSASASTSAPLQPPDPSALDQDEPQTSNERTRKGPSRSVAVCLSFSSFRSTNNQL